MRTYLVLTYVTQQRHPVAFLWAVLAILVLIGVSL